MFGLWTSITQPGASMFAPVINLTTLSPTLLTLIILSLSLGLTLSLSPLRLSLTWT